MPVDTSSYAEAAGAPKSLADYQAQYQGIAQNALNLQRSRQQLDSYTQDQAEKQSLRNYLSSSPDLSTAQGYNGLMSAAPTLGPGIHKTYQDSITSAALAQKDLGSAAESGQKVKDQAFAHYQNELGTVQSPQEAAAYITAAYHDPTVGPMLQQHGSLEDGLARLQQAVQAHGFDGWKANASIGMQKLAELAKVQTVDTGGTTSTQVYQPATGQVQTVASATKTATPGEVLSAQTSRRGQDMADRRVGEQMNQPEYKQGDDGTYYALPKKVAPGAAITGTAVMGPDGNPLQGKATLTETQGKATTFAARMQDADETIKKLESGGTKGSDFRTIMAGSGLTNWAASQEGQDYRQAQENWVTANLRQESGAAIGKDEMAKDVRKFFAAPGDGNSVIAQKARARAVAQQGMLVQAGPGARSVPGILAASHGDPASTSVQTPDGQTHTFPNAAAAAAFKKAAGI